MLSNKCLVVGSYQPIRTEKYKQKNFLPILNFSVVGLKMYAAIVIRPNWLFSHSNYLDSSLLVFSLWFNYIILTIFIEHFLQNYYFQATLAAVIITAVIFSVEYEVVMPMWKSKSKFLNHIFFGLSRFNHSTHITYFIIIFGQVRLSKG